MSTEFTLFGSAERTASATSATEQDPGEGFKGFWMFLDVTAASTTCTLAVRAQRLDSLTDKYIDIPGASMPTATAISTAEFTLYPGIAETANVSVSDHVTEKFRCIATLVGATSTPTLTYSVSGRWLK